jgi:hypothetical protein
MTGEPLNGQTETNHRAVATSRGVGHPGREVTVKALAVPAVAADNDCSAAMP